MKHNDFHPESQKSQLDEPSQPSAGWKLDRRRFLTGVATAAALTGMEAHALTSPAAGALTAGAGLWQGGESAAPLNASTRALMPVPASVQFRDGSLALTESFTVGVRGHDDPRLQRALRRFVGRLARRTGLNLDPLKRGDASSATLVVDCKGPMGEVPQLGDDESYTLEVGAQQAVLSAPTVLGALRGLQTALQLVEGAPSGYLWPQASIQDKPRFAWRGFMLDVSRHFQPIEVVKRNLDGMEAVKLNTFHWHLSDDQGFRAQSLRFPKLTGDGSDGEFYTQEQMRDVITYAADRGIRIVPEFDMPGHCTSWLVGYPELGSVPGPYHISRRFGIHNNAFDPTEEHLYKFLDVFFGEMAALFPDNYFHIGGDENRGKQWMANPKIRAFMAKKGFADPHALQAYFNVRIAPLITKHGKKMMGWEEILNPALPKDIMVQAWLSVPALAKIAKDGHQGILSAGYYLDLMWPADKHYLVDPVPENTDLTPDQIKNVLGGECCMWAEYTSYHVVDAHIWPRAAAIAERFWSPQQVKDVDDMYRRMALTSVSLEDLGIRHRENQDRLLRAMAQGEDVAPLQTLMAAVEPGKGYTLHAHHYDQYFPLVYMASAAPPESPLRRSLPRVVDSVLSGRGGEERLHRLFTSWQDAYPGYMVLRNRNPMLADVEPTAQTLAALGQAGLEALGYLRSGQTAPSDWHDRQTALLKQALIRHGDVELIVLPAWTELVIAAATPRTGARSAWRQQVKSTAASLIPKERWE